MNLEAIIFDLDGVIADTAEYQYRSWKRLLDEKGLPFSREDGELIRGVTRRESLRRILKGHPISEDDAQEWMIRKNDYYLEFLQELTPDDRAPGLTTLINDARAQQIKLAVATASRNAYPVLKQLALLDVFDVIGDPTSIVNPKPAPDLFIWVAGYLHAHIGQTLIIEDSEDGINAGINAGFWTFGVGPGNVDHAHIRHQSLADTSLEKILDHISKTAVIS